MAIVFGLTPLGTGVIREEEDEIVVFVETLEGSTVEMPITSIRVKS